MYGIHKYGKDSPHYGCKHSEETKRKLSKKRKENPSPTQFQKGHVGCNKGGTLESFHGKEKAKEIIAKNKGKNCYLWKGGITPENHKIRQSIENRLWREAVFARDNWACQGCYARSGNGKAVFLEAHHIKSFVKFPKLRFAIDNGLTLCKQCHNLTKKGRI